jgi:hypothetical protein
MSNFYTEEDQPLRKVRPLTLSHHLLLTQPPLKLSTLSEPRQSPLQIVTKLVLSEFERPLMCGRELKKTIKERKVRHESEQYVKNSGKRG